MNMKTTDNLTNGRNMLMTRAQVPYFSHSLRLNEFQKQIINNISDYVILTEKMLMVLLCRNETETGLPELKKELRYLVNNEYLAEYRIDDQELDCRILTAYVPARRGLGYLKSERIKRATEVGWVRHNIRIYTSSQTKLIKLIAGNNLMIHRYPGLKVDYGMMYSAEISKTKKSEKNKKKGLLFRSYISFANGEYGRTIIEPVRRGVEELDMLMNKLERIQKVAVCSSSNLNLFAENVIVLVAEDQEHMAEIFSILAEKSYRGFEIRITCDADNMEHMAYRQVTFKKRESFWRTLFAFAA